QPAYIGDGPGWLPQTANNEELPWPKRWKPLVHYPLGFSLMDGNGNLQTVVKEGRSGTIEPAWATGEGGVTTEPDWVNAGHTTDPGVNWKCTKVLRHAPTIARGESYALNEIGWDENGNRQQVTVAGTSDA